jgi:ABC-type antimicrobial peptide transport system permease subunit
LSRRAGRAVVAGGYTVLAAGGVLAGALAAVADRRLSGVGVPLFNDGWAVLAAPPSLRPAPIGLAVAGTALVLGLAAALSAWRLSTALRRTSRS